MSLACELLQKMQKDVLESLRAKDHDRADILRLVVSNLKTAKIDKGEDLSDEETVQILRSTINKCKEAEDQYRQVGAIGEADKERRQYQILERFMPVQLSDDELRTLIEREAKSVGANGIHDLGKLMGKIMPKVSGRAGGSRVYAMVKKFLAKH